MTALDRKLRRRAERLGGAKRAVQTFHLAIESLKKRKIRFSIDGRPSDDYIHHSTEQRGRRLVSTFRHPTKAATSGRLAFLTVEMPR